MPPCGYRPPAVSGLETFLSDNLRYFVELYRGRGMTISEALCAEAGEIELIRSGVRGGPWATRTVEINELFYKRLAEAQPQTWADIDSLGAKIISDAVAELSSLLPETVPAAAE